MRIHAATQQLNGIVSVTMSAKFMGDSTDTTDKQRILAYGDPLVNLVGLFTDPSNTGFQFSFPATEFFVGLTTQMQGYTANFMEALPTANIPGQPCATLGPLECITANPNEAATVWATTIQARAAAAMTTLRALPAQITPIADATI
jgi:hypothetical protein